MRYEKPATLDKALELLAEGRWRVLAGATDFYPAQGAKPLRDDIMDINGLAELRGVSCEEGALRIGARTTWTDILRAPLPPSFDGLKAAASEVGSIQIQNAGTVAGNLCNASPAADGVPPLMTLDAEVELRSASGARRLALGDFILGNRRTAIRPGELLTAVIVPEHSATGTSAFVKLGARRYLVISIAMAAARLEFGGDGGVAQAAVAVGSCSAVACRLAGLEAALTGRRPGDFAAILADEPLAELSPIDDVRASADYRRQAAREIVLRTLLQASDHLREHAA